MQYSQEHLKTMVYAEFGGQTECIMGNSKIENRPFSRFFHLCPRFSIGGMKAMSRGFSGGQTSDEIS